MRRLALLLAPLTFAVACGGASTTTTTTPTATTSTATTQPVGGDVKADTSGVAKPASVLLVTRFNDLSKSIDAVDHVLKLPQSLRSLLDAAMSAQGMGFIQLAGSFDVVVALDPSSRDNDPKFLWAFSVPLKNIDDAVAQAEKVGKEVRPTTPGSYRVKLKGGIQCELTASVGDAPNRAICSEQAAALADLTPYMARGLAAEPKKSADVWVRAEAGPLKERYINMLKSKADGMLGEARSGMQSALGVSNPNLLDAPSVIAKELFAFSDDAEAVELSFSLDDKKPEMKLTGALVFKSKSSWITQVLASAGEKPEGPPDIFYRLPKDATTATWSRSADPTLFTGVRKILHKGFGTLLAMRQASQFVSDADKQAILGWVDGIPTFSGVAVGASGSLPATKMPEKNLTAQQAVEEAKNMAKRFVPWSIAGGDGDGASIIAWLKSTDDVVNRGVADVQKVAGKDAMKKLGWLPTSKFTKDPAGWPKGSATLDITVAYTSKDVWSMLPQNKYQDMGNGKFDRPEHPAGAEAKGSITMRLAVAPDTDGHFWWGYSVDPEALKAKMTGAMKSAPASGTIASRTDLDALKAHKGLGGYMSYGAILDTLKNGDILSANDKKDMDAVVAKLPHKAQGAVFFYGSSTGGSAPTLALDIVIGKDAVEDLSSAVNQGFALMGGFGGGKSSPPSPPVAPVQPRH